jgi:hypothetical protein
MKVAHSEQRLCLEVPVMRRALKPSDPFGAARRNSGSLDIAPPDAILGFRKTDATGAGIVPEG